MRGSLTDRKPRHYNSSRESALLDEEDITEEYPYEGYDLRVTHLILSMMCPWLNRNSYRRGRSGINKLLVRGQSTLFLWVPIVRTIRSLFNVSVYYIDERFIRTENHDLFQTLDEIVLHHPHNRCLIIISNADHVLNIGYNNGDETPLLLSKYIDACHPGIKFVMTESTRRLDQHFPSHLIINQRPPTDEEKKKMMLDSLKVTFYFKGEDYDGTPFNFSGNFSPHILTDEIKMDTFLNHITWMNPARIQDFVECMHILHFLSHYDDVIRPLKLNSGNIYHLFKKIDVLDYYNAIYDEFDTF